MLPRRRILGRDKSQSGFISIQNWCYLDEELWVEINTILGLLRPRIWVISMKNFGSRQTPFWVFLVPELGLSRRRILGRDKHHSGFISTQNWGYLDEEFWVEINTILGLSRSRIGVISSISESKFRRLGLPNRGFRIAGIAKIDFSWKSFSMNFGIDYYRLLRALGIVFLIF